MKMKLFSFNKRYSNGEFVALLIYVDDIMLASSSIIMENETKQFLNFNFKLKDLCAPKYFSWYIDN